MQARPSSTARYKVINKKGGFPCTTAISDVQLSRNGVVPILRNSNHPLFHPCFSSNSDWPSLMTPANVPRLGNSCA